jgi:hypothetical protein
MIEARVFWWEMMEVSRIQRGSTGRLISGVEGDIVLVFGEEYIR